MPQIITVTINPAVDVSTSVDRVEPVRKLRCRTERREPGGGGINVARVINRLGGDVLAVYAAGGVIGGLLHELVEKEGVTAHAVEIAGVTRESFTVLDETTRSEFRFVLPGPELSDSEWCDCLEQVERIASRQGYIIASGSLAVGVPDDFYARLARVAKKSDCRFIVDASGSPLKAALEAGVYLAKPNLRELQDMLGEPLADRGSQISACRRLVKQGNAEIVALSLGSAGALVVTKDLAWFSEPLAVKVMSSVGAGDSFLGAMAWSLSSGRGLEEALRHAVAAGSAALLAPGTQLCDPADVVRLSSDVKLSLVG
jgi:6-phosphofructokinase 2